MSAIHYETFRVRYYECDAYGHLTNINHLRWMQEAAFGASLAVGYDFAHYSETGYLWLVRETDIEYTTPLEYGVQVQVKTWVADFRRAHSLRRYEFINTRTEQVAARAATDWVYIDTEKLSPVTVPEAMQEAFCPDGSPEAGKRRERFPKASSVTTKVFTQQRRVEWRDIDTMWHVNNAVYLKYLEDADSGMCEAHGWSKQRMVESGIGVKVRRYKIEYRQPAQMGEEIEIATWGGKGKEASALRHYTIRRARDKALLARARVNWEWVDMRTAESVKAPEDFLIY
jgi:acyl-CoA thioester hydrolase